MTPASQSTAQSVPRLRLSRATVPARWVLLIALATSAISGMATLSHAQTTPFPVVLTMSGPATAVSGQEVTYRVHYRLTDPATLAGATFRMRIPRNTAYVSTQVVSGPAGTFIPYLEDGLVDWAVPLNADEAEGDVELTVRIDPDFVGLIYGECYIPGTETGNPESHCSAQTDVSAAGATPEESDDGGSTAQPWLYVGLVVLGLIAAGVVGALAVRRFMRRAS